MVFRIKEARKAAKLTQKELAEKLGIKVSTLSGYEIGAHDPKSNTLSQIAQIGNTPVDFLLGIDEQQEAPVIDATNYTPQTIEARIVSGGMDKLPEAQRQQILGVVRAMFANDPDLFKDGEDK